MKRWRKEGERKDQKWKGRGEGSKKGRSKSGMGGIEGVSK